jgi:hypothetical protein
MSRVLAFKVGGKAPLSHAHLAVVVVRLSDEELLMLPGCEQPASARLALVIAATSRQDRNSGQDDNVLRP